MDDVNGVRVGGEIEMTKPWKGQPKRLGYVAIV